MATVRKPLQIGIAGGSVALVVALVVALAVGLAACSPLAGADTAAAAAPSTTFQPLAPIGPATGIQVDLRLPIGGYFRSGCRLPVAVRIQSATDRRIRVAVVPELWQVEKQAVELGAGEVPTLDFQTLAGGSWSPPTVCNAVSGAGAAGVVLPLLPVIDDIRRHLVVVELQGEGDRRGKVIFRADLAPLLHELLPDERLVVLVSPPTPAGTPPPVDLPPIPATVRLPDGSTVTPRVVTVTPGDLPTTAAGWRAIDLAALPDRLFALEGAAGEALSAAQQAAFDEHLTAGAQAVISVEPPSPLEHYPGPSQYLKHWSRLHGPVTGLPFPVKGRAAENIAVLGSFPPDFAKAGWIEAPLGWGGAWLNWMPPKLDEPTQAVWEGHWRVRWSAILSQQLAARDPRLQPRERIDQEAYASVFDPQIARLPQRLILQVWWFLAAVTAAFLILGALALRRTRPATDAAQPNDPVTAPPARQGWVHYSALAGGCMAVALLASLYASRARVSAIEWRLQLTAADGRRVDRTYTYLVAWRSVGGLNVTATPPLGGDGADPARDGRPICAALRDLQDESGRQPAAPVRSAAEPIEAVTVDSARPLLLRTDRTQVTLEVVPEFTPAEIPPKGASTKWASAVAALLRANPGDWAVMLEAPADDAPPARLATDHTGYALIPPTESGGTWQAEPLWLAGAQLNVPAMLHAQEDIYKPATMKWLFGQIRQVTAAPVLVIFRRRAFTDCAWQVGYATPGTVVLDDSLLVRVVELP